MIVTRATPMLNEFGIDIAAMAANRAPTEGCAFSSWKAGRVTSRAATVAGIITRRRPKRSERRPPSGANARTQAPLTTPTPNPACGGRCRVSWA